jgi:hypothetical protein
MMMKLGYTGPGIRTARTMSDDYMKDQGEALAQHLRLTDGKSGYVEATADGFQVYVHKKWSGKQITSEAMTVCQTAPDGWFAARTCISWHTANRFHVDGVLKIQRGMPM